MFIYINAIDVLSSYEHRHANGEGRLDALAQFGIGIVVYEFSGGIVCLLLKISLTAKFLLVGETVVECRWIY